MGSQKAWFLTETLISWTASSKSSSKSMALSYTWQQRIILKVADKLRFWIAYWSSICKSSCITSPRNGESFSAWQDGVITPLAIRPPIWPRMRWLMVNHPPVYHTSYWLLFCRGIRFSAAFTTRGFPTSLTKAWTCLGDNEERFWHASSWCIIQHWR